MGLDIYAGTLTRYYARNWKTTVQQWAEENGYTYNRFGPGGEMEQEQKPDPQEVLAAIEGWRDAVLGALRNSGMDYPSWPEDNEAPYYTDKPDWDAFCALLLAECCGVLGEEVPKTVPKGWSGGFWDDPRVKRGAEKAGGSLLAGAQLWLPIGEPFWFGFQNPVGTQITISTTGGLRQELEAINRLLWQAGEEEILSWTAKEGYPAEGEIGPDGRYAATAAVTEYDTQSLAKMAYSILCRAERFAREHRSVVLMDF